MIVAKASELLNTAEHKAAAAADVIATKAVEAKNTTVAAAQNAASTVQGNSLILFSFVSNTHPFLHLEKTSALVDSSKHALSSSSTPSQPAPVAPARTDLITQEAYVTETSGQTAHGPEPALTASAATGAVTTTSKSSKGGPINAIRNFFSRLFRSARHEDRQVKTDNDVVTTEAVQVTETVTTTTVATSNPPN